MKTWRGSIRLVITFMVWFDSHCNVGPVHTEARLGRNNTLTRNFDELQIFKYPKATDMVDLGEESMFEARRVKIEELRNNTILAVTDAKTYKLEERIMYREEGLKNASIVAFIFISNIDYMNKVINLNTTFDGDLPSTILLKGSIEWNK